MYITKFRLLTCARTVSAEPPARGAIRCIDVIIRVDRGPAPAAD
jgi:hypothetical protein